MSLFSIFRRPLLLAVPVVALAFGGCSKKDEPTPTPAPDQGKVAFVNAAAHIAPVTLKFLADNSEKASQAYGTTSGYQNVLIGSRPIQVMAGSQSALTQSVTIEKDKNYTFIATPATSSSAVGGLFLTDDLSVPNPAKARIRVVHLGQNVSSPIKLSQVTSTANGPVVVDIVTNVASNTVSAITDFNPGTYNLSILDNAGVSRAEVGSGNGAGTGTKTYEAGKVYTLIVSGTAGSLNSEQSLKAFLSQNN